MKLKELLSEWGADSEEHPSYHYSSLLGKYLQEHIPNLEYSIEQWPGIVRMSVWVGPKHARIEIADDGEAEVLYHPNHPANRSHASIQRPGSVPLRDTALQYLDVDIHAPTSFPEILEFLKKWVFREAR